VRWAGCFFIAASACYSPTVPAGAPCDPALNNCPAGQRCETTAGGSYCGAVAFGLDGGGNGTSDGPHDTAPGCYGIGLVHDVCLMPAPTAELIIAADRTVNTATVGNGNCDEIIAQPGGGASLCLITARALTLASMTRLTGLGPNPLLLVATETMTIDGTIDVASRLGAPQPGAGADMTCASPAGSNATQIDGAGGGGAGGSFGTNGGNGGTGRTPNQATQGGTAPAAQIPTTLRGGCAGGRGGQADGGGGEGVGGAGGGAVYLIAGSSITISGAINASGSGGAQGTDGQFASGGAGGGGSGGMIGLDAPSISVTGMVFANGGGGGGGGGDSPDRHGQPGATATLALVPANGGPGGNGGGGRGGEGSVLDGAGATANNGTNPYCAGGGGGGGAGVIRVYGVAPSSLGGMISPPPM
jgi:hypothetical protein